MLEVMAAKYSFLNEQECETYSIPHEASILCEALGLVRSVLESTDFVANAQQLNEPTQVVVEHCHEEQLNDGFEQHSDARVRYYDGPRLENDLDWFQIKFIAIPKEYETSKNITKTKQVDPSSSC